MAEFAKILAQLRERSGMRQKTLANLIGVTPSVVSQYETGKTMPGYDVMLRIADHFHVSVDFLLGRDARALETDRWLNNCYIDNLTNRQLLEQCATLPQSQRKVLCGVLQVLIREDNA